MPKLCFSYTDIFATVLFFLRAQIALLKYFARSACYTILVIGARPALYTDLHCLSHMVLVSFLYTVYIHWNETLFAQVHGATHDSWVAQYTGPSISHSLKIYNLFKKQRAENCPTSVHIKIWIEYLWRIALGAKIELTDRNFFFPSCELSQYPQH